MPQNPPVEHGFGVVIVSDLEFKSPWWIYLLVHPLPSLNTVFDK